MGKKKTKSVSSNTNNQGVLETIAATRNVCDQVKAVFNNINAVLVQNNVDATDYNALTHETDPAIVDEDGFIVGEKFTPADVANAINSLDNVQKLYSGQAAAVGPWGELMERLSRSL